ncbi:MAG: hypothetical protein QM737_01065 [Ferruginibacter sp.]
MPTKKEHAIITDKLVIEKTGKPMETWFKMLDKKGAKEMKHIDIFHLVSSIEGLKQLGQWNQNLFTTTYEWNRGMKERGEKEGGFEIGVSKTINVSIDILYNSWVDDKARNKWLPKEKITIRKSTLNKSARITWSDNKTSLSVDFYPKGENKSQVVVQHQKITDSKMATKMKSYWGDTLESLKTLLEK